MASTPPNRPSLTENPWLWLTLFGGMGILAIVVIGPKYAARQARIERMADSRARAQAAKLAGVAPSEVDIQRPQAEPGRDEPYIEADFRRPPQLYWLLTLMTLLMLVGTGGLLVSRRRSKRTADTIANPSP